ncbi:DUF3653 domain-containing protein [Roseateles sp. SL47]|uniref:DUF3653 domain-containing protein n=1 Tax=Roseateles sp. SL47 TaxID=2995138 RepID=UPI00226D4E47|nr:DUF3653 domain-containing protein [Roseateles sp. SL47]WAC75894.1 DUF3653 domain-containing protein [Roseateles sp. SL47]
MLRWMTWRELPGQAWQGWYFGGGRLWTPEGNSFSPKDFSWMSLTVRQARMFGVVYRECSQLRRSLLEARQQLNAAKELSAAAESRASVLELALWGVLERRRQQALEALGEPGNRAEREPGLTRCLHRDGPVTRSEILTGENFASQIAQLHLPAMVGTDAVFGAFRGDALVTRHQLLNFGQAARSEVRDV